MFKQLLLACLVVVAISTAMAIEDHMDPGNFELEERDLELPTNDRELEDDNDMGETDKKALERLERRVEDTYPGEASDPAEEREVKRWWWHHKTVHHHHHHYHYHHHYHGRR
ncbi:hypothetical protein, partial [Salmonella sp. s55004]|uniref:hypothetical protein n=1 Tax=Salmonella sp. s55004 TaxID=3159675 RepID=UPI0039801FD7